MIEYPVGVNDHVRAHYTCTIERFHEALELAHDPVPAGNYSASDHCARVGVTVEPLDGSTLRNVVVARHSRQPPEGACRNVHFRWQPPAPSGIHGLRLLNSEPVDGCTDERLATVGVA
jgi:hypothetical protein